MGDFVSGVVSGLIGAVVGGAFTALAARAQVKAVIAVAHLQIETDRKRQAEAAFYSQRRAEAEELCRRIVAMMHEVQVMGDEHWHAFHSGDSECLEPVPNEGQIRQVNEWRRQLDWITYQYKDFLTEVGEEYIYLESIFAYVLSGNDWESLRGKRYAESPECFRDGWSEEFHRELSELLDRVQVERSRYLGY